METKNQRKRVQSKFSGESLTRQSERYLSDIERVRKQGMAPIDPAQLVFADVSSEFDFAAANQQIVQIKQSFAQLPSDVRKRFANDPAQLMEFVRDPSNLEEARDLGLVLPPETAPEPAPEPVKPTPAPEPPAPEKPKKTDS